MIAIIGGTGILRGGHHHALIFDHAREIIRYMNEICKMNDREEVEVEPLACLELH